MNRKELQEIAGAINLLTRYLGVRDIPSLDRRKMADAIGLDQVDLLMLFGGTIPFAADVAAWAMNAEAAKKLMIVGGVGHTTESLREKIRARFPEIPTAGRGEAEIYAAYLEREYGIKHPLLEIKSTNCGNNVTNALALLKAEHLHPETIVIMQDPSMQRRMAAGFQKALADEKDAPRILNYAPYLPEVIVQDEALTFREHFWGLWEIPEYVSLLLGDVARLRDDENGYGPNGKNYIPHVDVPPVVLSVFQLLQDKGIGKVRPANEAYKNERFIANA